MDQDEKRKPEISGGILPLPMESLYETPVPPFLSKTFDLVDDSSLDAIISWGANGSSFVVWDHLEFARSVLPSNFKHNNFSSFVRQLNTYGFRKIDTDKWEFANEGFLRGQRHLLRNIQRRKSHQSHQTGSSSGAHLEDEIDRLRKERSSMMREVVELQQQQCGTAQQIGITNEKLEAAEKRQKQLVSFLAKMFQNPVFLARLHRMREQKSIGSTRTSRKFVEHQPHVPAANIPEWLLQDIGDHTVFGADDIPYQDFGQDELAMVHELLDTPEKCDVVPTLDNEDPLTKGKGLVNPEFFVSFPDDLATEKSPTEHVIQDSEDIVTGNVWSMGFGTRVGMSSSSSELWGNLSGYDVPEFGVDGGLSDIWDIGSLNQAERSGNEKWPDEDFPPVDLENPDF